MPNMSYCRFRNTLSDLRDCQEALVDLACDGEDSLSDEEKRAKDSLIALCHEIAGEYDDGS
jgi:hypothetical protein